MTLSLHFMADSLFSLFFFLLSRRPPRSTLFPYTPLFRSLLAELHRSPMHSLPPAMHRGLDLPGRAALETALHDIDRKSTRLNSSHVEISYAVFCLKKKKNKLEKTTIIFNNAETSFTNN